MFLSEAKTPLHLNNVLNRMILPALNRCEVCRKERSEHVQADHQFKVKTVSTDSTAAMKLLETALCANCAPLQVPGNQDVVN